MVRVEKCHFSAIVAASREGFWGGLVASEELSIGSLCKTVYRTVCKTFCKRFVTGRRGLLVKGLRPVTVK